MSIALSAGQNILELLEERLSPLRVGPAQQLLGLLPRQLEAVQSRADRLAAAHQPEPLADPADQAVQRPARRWIGPGSGRRRGCALGGADDLAGGGFGAVRGAAGWPWRGRVPRGVKKGGRRPPVRRKASAAGPPWL